MKRSLIIALFAILGITGVSAALAAVYARHVVAAGKAARAPQDDPTGENPVSVIRFVRNPTPLPPFLVNDLDGNIVSTSGLHGKVVLLNFWATWCPPCREEIPEMIELAGRFKDRLQIIGVSEDDDPPGRVRDFAKQAGINYPVIMGSKEISDEYGGVPALPTTFVVDTNGGIVQKHVGVYPIDVYENEIRALLNMPVDKKIETFEDTGQIFLKNASRATSLPGVDFSRLTPDQKRRALKRLNSEFCTCGCKLTIAQCRINDEECSTSQRLAAQIVRQTASPRSPSKGIQAAHPQTPPAH